MDATEVPTTLLMVLDFFSGCIGACAGVIIGHPFDTIKVLLQIQDHKKPKYTGVWDCFKSLIRNEKLTGLFKGVSSPLGGVSLMNLIVFGSQSQIQSWIGPDEWHAQYSAGAAAGLLQSFICSPVELAKTILQVQKKKRYTGTIDCLTKIFKLTGFKGVYKGLSLTMMREVPAYASYFAIFDLLSGGLDAPNWRTMLAGGSAGSLSWLLVYPVDVLKTRLQSDGINSARQYRGPFHCLTLSYKTEGIGFLTKGLSSTLIRAFPTNAVTFSVVTWAMRYSEAFILGHPACILICAHTCVY